MPASFQPAMELRDVAEQIKRAMPLRQVFRLVGWKTHGRRADCGLCKGSSQGTIAFNDRLWRCHRCCKGGSIFDLIMAANGCDFVTALKYLAGVASVPVPGKMTAEEKRQWAELNRQHEECDNAWDDFEKQDRALRLACRRLIHLCDDVLGMPGEWTDEQWRFARIAYELREEYLLPEYTLLSFGSVERRKDYILAGEVERVVMVLAVRRVGGITAHDGHFIGVML